MRTKEAFLQRKDVTDFTQNSSRVFNPLIRNFKYSGPRQIAPRQVAPSLRIAPVFRAGIVVQFGDLALKQFQIEVFKIIQIGSNKTFIECSAKDNFIHSFLQKKLHYSCLSRP